MDSLPDRPRPARPIAESAHAWLQWFGVVRLVVTASAVIAVAAGAWWLLRAPAAPVEDTLPVASRVVGVSTTVAEGTAGSDVAGTSVVVATTASAPVVTPATVIVYVAGAVTTPGVYDLTGPARVRDAIGAAGGLLSTADVDALNLAALVRDGDRVYVPAVGQAVPAVVAPSGGSDASSGSMLADGSGKPVGPVDLNRATVEQLDALPGVGPSTAAAIIAYRDLNGPFAAVDDLLRVRGIGPSKLDAIRTMVTV